MSRLIAAVVTSFALAPSALAHAPYLVPAAPDARTPHPTLTVVFSDSLQPDARVKPASWAKLDGLTLSATGADGAVTPLVLAPGEHCRTSPLPADARLVRGSVVYGVSQKGDAPAMLLTYYLKAVLGPVPPVPGVVADGLDIAPVAEGKTLRFRVVDGGKPVANSEVTLLVESTGETRKLATDRTGLTPPVAAAGRVAVTARVEVAGGGEYGGQTFAKRVRVATLVVGR